MVLQSDLTFFEGAEIRHGFELAIGYQFFPVVIPKRGGKGMPPIQVKIEFAMISHNFSKVPLPGWLYSFFCRDQVIQITCTMLVYFRIRMPFIGSGTIVQN